MALGGKPVGHLADADDDGDAGDDGDCGGDGDDDDDADATDDAGDDDDDGDENDDHVDEDDDNDDDDDAYERRQPPVLCMWRVSILCHSPPVYLEKKGSALPIHAKIRKPATKGRALPCTAG